MGHLLAISFSVLLLPLGLLAQDPNSPINPNRPRPPIIGAIAKPGDLPRQIKSEGAKNHIGETITVCDVVMDGKYLESSSTQPTLLNLGATSPNQHLTIFISKEVRASFDIKPEDYFKGKKICVTGKITEFKGKPQIVLLKKEDIKAE